MRALRVRERAASKLPTLFSFLVFTFGVGLPQRPKTQFLQTKPIKTGCTHKNIFIFWRFLLSLEPYLPIYL